MKIALVCSRIRVEEKMLFRRFIADGIDCQRLDEREITWDLVDLGSTASRWESYDAVLNRSISQSRSVVVSRFFEELKVPVVNSSRVIDLTGDKALTSMRLAAEGIPIPRTAVAFTTEQALRIVEDWGYPVVIKPTVGSWGRLMARVNDRDAAEAVLEHKSHLGSPQHGILYIQEYVDKPGRDIRVFCIFGQPVCAIYRYSDHWITNTARGARAERAVVGREMEEICRGASRAVGDGVLAIDLLEKENGYLVTEINHSIEFRNSIDTTGVDLVGYIVDAVVSRARGGSDDTV